MTRTRLRNKYFKIKTIESKTAYNKQRNLCLSLIRSSKRKFYNNLDHRKVTDNKLFWRVIGPCFSEKGSTSSKITLVEDETVQDNEKIANIFNDYFSNVVSSLSIPEYVDLSVDLDNFEDPFLKSIDKFKNHQSIIEILNHTHSNMYFSFETITTGYLASLIRKLDTSKSIQKDDIPTNILKENIDIVASILNENINYSFTSCIFPEELKIAEVIPIYKKDSKTDKSNYRPVSLLLNISKIYEMSIYDQLSAYFDKILSIYQFGFRKGVSAQQCLMLLIETWKNSVDNKNSFGTLLTDLSKALDCINNDLLVAKLNAYGVDKYCLKLIFSYLKNKTQRVRIDNTWSSWKTVKFGVPQGSILGPLLFNIYLCDLFYFISKWPVANYADDTTPYFNGRNIPEVIDSIEQCAKIIFH